MHWSVLRMDYVQTGWACCGTLGVYMISVDKIKPDLPVVCSNDGQFAVVDHMQGSDSIKLKRDKKDGRHHFIPLSWVTTVDDKVHIDRPGDVAMKEWTTTDIRHPVSTDPL